MNKFIGVGRLVKDSELSYIPGTGTPKITYTIAIDRSYQKDKNNKKVDFINCEQLGKHCENLCQYVTKGKMIVIEGELNIDQYSGSDGTTKYMTKIKVDRLEFVAGTSSKSDEAKGLEPQGFQVIDDDDIQF